MLIEWVYLKIYPLNEKLVKDIDGQEQVIADDPTIGDYFISEPKYKELDSCSIAKRDILISLVGTIGKVLVLPDNCKEGIINPRLIKVSLLHDFYSAQFFKFYFESSFVKSLYSKDAHGATMNILNLGIIKRLPFPLSSIEEQTQIVSELEERLSVVEQLEAATRTAQLKAKNLRRSILQRAFEGKLI
ncbi:MAG: restriction endonuclease subunit S [Cyclobacteriaceae bacterium]